ncbi:hypothetical protein NC651_006523 [Populus alba x Populus x berolinensis]|nr:hypothetical protein NC651_006523 [Populus alba x Populus x berolinensis]
MGWSYQNCHISGHLGNLLGQQQISMLYPH